jgi:hypothetical protein
MYISKKDLEFLIKVECYLFTKNLDLYNEMYILTERLMKQKEKNNKASWERIKEKREIDKNYARSKKASL